ncbi:MAG: MazG family protein, partial [Spirochaetia bacterium]|nr:MazG family protein [Spirochaetia bacterium]
MKELDELLLVMDRLRGENGCNWDKKQTHESLIPYLLEESYEVVDALEKRDKENLKEELGDLLFQIVFHSKLASESKEFEMKDVALGITQKLIRRHPHVFSEKEDLHPDEVIANWARIKEKEKS